MENIYIENFYDPILFDSEPIEIDWNIYDFDPQTQELIDSYH